MQEEDTSERRGVWSILSNPVVYEVFHHLIGARRWLKEFARTMIRPRHGDRVLDIGCGPGALLRYLPDGTTYVGLDRNGQYIAQAVREHGSRGTFIQDDVANYSTLGLERVDVAVAIGLLHHLDDQLASTLLGDIERTLKPGGRLITVDPCYHPDQSFAQRFVVSKDRGLHVRFFSHYVELCKRSFPRAASLYDSGHFPFPHSICVIQATCDA